MGIVLKKKEVVDVSVTMREKKPRYKNADLPFENPAEDLERWQQKVLPALTDWAGSLDEPFSVGSHQDFNSMVEALWVDVFPELDMTPAVISVVSLDRQERTRSLTSSLGCFGCPQLAKQTREICTAGCFQYYQGR